MIYNVYAIRYKQVGYMSPMVDATDGSACRNFARAVNQPNTVYDFSPKDFDLYLIGNFNDQTGVITPVDPPRCVVSAESLVGGKYAE